MQSDTRVARALDAVAEPIREFRAALANTTEQVRLLISTHVEHPGASVEGARAEFGNFAAGRIDAERMSRVLSHAEPRDVEHGDALVRALTTCEALVARGERLFRVTVGEGEDLRSIVAQALAEIGTAFGAARVADLVSERAYRESDHAALLAAHPFEHWSRTERAVPLGLVVCVAGSDLRVAGLADYLDPALKLVLVVQGEGPPAALTRLITPDVFVLQTSDVQDLEALARFDGPATAALVSSSAAHFRHDPRAGCRIEDRLVVARLPEREERTARRLGVTSAFQQQQDLAQLEALAAAGVRVAEPLVAERVSEPVGPAMPEPAVPVDSASPAAPPAAPSALPPADPVGKLSAWLLRQADLPGRA